MKKDIKEIKRNNLIRMWRNCSCSMIRCLECAAYDKISDRCCIMYFDDEHSYRTQLIPIMLEYFTEEELFLELL